MQYSHFQGQFANYSAVDPTFSRSAVPTPTLDRGIPDVWDEGNPSIDIEDWLSNHTHSTSSLPTSSSEPALSPAAATRTTPYPSGATTQEELQLSIEQLLENPLTAALVAAQLKQRAAQAPQPTANTPTAPIAKPRAKRNKVRPKDTLDMLQKHLDDITAQVSELSVTNEQLQKKNRVLDQMVEAVGYFEGLAARACEEVARHNKDPSQPLQGAVRCKDWTAAQFLAFYRSKVASSSKWLLAADDQITPEVNAQLTAVNSEILDLVYHLCYFQPAIMPSVKAEVLKDWGSSTTTEERHWLEVVKAMELSGEQVELLLVARDVYFRLLSRVARDTEMLQATIDSTILQPTDMHSFCTVLCADDEVLLAKVADNLRKHAGLTVVLAMFTFSRLLTPLQVARCALHAHPLFPDPVIVLNAIHASTTTHASPLDQPTALLPPPAPSVARPAGAHPSLQWSHPLRAQRQCT